MSGAFNIPDPLVLEGDVSHNYNTFVEKFKKFFSSLEYVHGLPEKEKIAIFLVAIGKDSSKVFESFDLSTDDPSVTLEVVMERFELYCKSYQDNVVYHSCEFLNRNQLENETFDDYFDGLCDLAGRCDYSTNDKERLIRDKFVAGLRSLDVREEIFRKGFENPGEIIEYCRERDIKKEEEMTDADKQEDLNHETDKNEQEDEQIEENSYGNVKLKSEPSFHLNSDGMNVKEEYDPDFLEKGEVLTNDCLVRNYSRSNIIDTDMVENWETASNEATEVNSNCPIPESTPEFVEEPNNNFFTGESVQIEEAQTTNSTDDHEIITIDSSDTEAFEESSRDSQPVFKKNYSLRKRKSRKSNRIYDSESSDEENYNPTPPQKIRHEDKKPPVRYRQTPLNFPKRKHLTNPSDSKKFHQLQLCDEKFNKFFNRAETQEVHVKEESHECLLCPRKFGTENSLNSHVRNVHRVMNINAKKKILESSVKVEKFFYCTQCSCKYKHQRSLKAHVFKKHKKEESEEESDESDESVSMLSSILVKSQKIELDNN